MELLDDEGLDALTMRSLSERLEVVPMALYRHVKNKDDLLDGVLDRAVSLVGVPGPGLGWREGLTALARSIRTTMLAHPSIAGAIVSRPSLGPHSLVIGEYGFSVMRENGFSDADTERGLNVVLTYTLGFVALEVPRTHAPTIRLADLDAAYEQLPADLFPHTAAIRPSFVGFFSDSQFEFGLETILDGLELRLPTGRRRATRAATSTRSTAS